ncbi:MAG: isopentenyl phosphate kinase family protein [Candidatus Aenigmarchaeota archaeon]|nr:isopentenyl phosphate kinase family protein [Candidatus Aenigmarchaeota archaeon]
MKNITILKIGGSLITEKDKDVPTINYPNLKRFAKEVAESYQKEKSPLVFVHGVGSFGHVIVHKTGIHKGLTKESHLIDFAETQRLQNELNVAVVQEFIKNNIPAMPVQASASAVMEKGTIKSMDVKAISGMLDIGLMPTLFGVPAYDSKQGCSILSGDDICVYLAKMLNATRLIHATDVDGVFDSNPKENPNAKIISHITRQNFEEVLKKTTGSSNTDVTGGMKNKIKGLLELVGTTTEIINGNKKGYIKRALLGEVGLGTRIC